VACDLKAHGKFFRTSFQFPAVRPQRELQVGFLWRWSHPSKNKAGLKKFGLR
jgi:hypothetical protein